MRFRYPRARCVALALNGAIAPLALLRDEINACVFYGEVRPSLSPLGPEPDSQETLSVERILPKVRLHQSLEEPTLLELGTRTGADVI